MKRHGLLPFLGAGALLASVSSPSLLAQVPSLGSAENFAVLAASTVTNTGATTLTGDLGLSPGTAITGFPPGIVIGTIHAADPVALQAQADLTVAYNNLAGMPCTTTLTGQNLGGLTLTPGVYCFATTAQLTGTLTLDAQGNPNAVFVIQLGTALTTAAASAVQVINGGKPSNVFWQVGSSATLGAGTAFAGNLVALASVTLGAGTSVTGRVLARTAAVTMDTNTVTALTPTVGAVPYGTSTPGCAGPLAIGVNSMPQVGNASFAITCDNAPPNLSAGPGGVLALSNAALATPVSMAGADVWVDGAQTAHFPVIAGSNAAGATVIPIPIPNDPALAGLQVFAQFFWVGPSSPPPCAPGGISASNALAITVQS
jgi:ice-binding like protein